jgi:hypothetical protein
MIWRYYNNRSGFNDFWGNQWKIVKKRRNNALRTKKAHKIVANQKDLGIIRHGHDLTRCPVELVIKFYLNDVTAKNSTNPKLIGDCSSSFAKRI